ncbi:MAG: hypothetical protein GY930_15610 [bacterium]|nr:hypothetical protein [bacterium]
MIRLAGALCFLSLSMGILLASPLPCVQEGVEWRGAILDLESEFQVRRFSLDPAGTQVIWQPMLGSPNWLRRYDVLDAMQRNPEAARWFCARQKKTLRESLTHERSAVRAAAWRIVRMGQGLGSDCVDWQLGVGGHGSLGDEGQASFEAALSESSLSGGDTRSAAYSAALESFAEHESDDTKSLIPKSRASVVHAGFIDGEVGIDPWWCDVGGERVFRGLLATDLRVLVSEQTLQALRERAKETSVDVRFQIEAMALAQFAMAGQPEGGLDSIDWTLLEKGLASWPNTEGSEVFPLRGRIAFIKELAQLDVPWLSRIFWRVAMDVEGHIGARSIARLGGVEKVRFMYLSWASSSASMAVTLARSLNGGSDLQAQVWSTLEGDARDFPLKALEPFLQEHWDEEVQQNAVGRLWSSPKSDERRRLLLRAVETCRGEALRLAFRALARGEERAQVQAALHSVWEQRSSEERRELLRELPNSSVWTAFTQDWLESVRELGPSNLLELEHLSYLAVDPRWQALFERDFAEAFDRRFGVWESGKEPVSRDLARRATALFRVQCAGEGKGAGSIEGNVLVRGLMRRARWLVALPPERLEDARFDYCKACIALFAKDKQFQAWALAHLDEIQTWPRRLQVEVGIGLSPDSYSGLENELALFVARVESEFYGQLGSVLKGRWLAEGARASKLFAAEATNRKAPSSVRQAAMVGLAKAGRLQELIDVLNSDTGVTGPQLAMETLLPLPGDQIDKALRARWQRAKDAAQAGGANSEIERHLEMELFLILVKRRALSLQEIAQSFAGPMAQRFAQLEHRMDGEAAGEGWRPQLHVVQQLAELGVLQGLLEINPDWSTLDGRFLGKLAQAAWDAGDEGSADILSRWAEVALAGEPSTNRWWRPALGVRILRYRLARKTGDLANTAWYCERLLQDLLRQSQEYTPIESMLGGHDICKGRHPIAFLSALRLQSLAMLAARERDGLRSQMLLQQAERFCGVSSRAREQQVRAKRWIATR